MKIYKTIAFTVYLLLMFSKLRAETEEVEEKKYPYQLSICTMFQNDARFLREWIEFHLLVGVEHFYLFNNLSTDNYLEVLNPYIQSGIVELIDWPLASIADRQLQLIQTNAFQAGIHRSKNETKWLAIVDTDEFILPTQLAPYILCYDFKKLPRWRSQQRSQGFFLGELLDTSDW